MRNSPLASCSSAVLIWTRRDPFGLDVLTPFHWWAQRRAFPPCLQSIHHSSPRFPPWSHRGPHRSCSSPSAASCVGHPAAGSRNRCTTACCAPPGTRCCTTWSSTGCPAGDLVHTAKEEQENNSFVALTHQRNFLRLGLRQWDLTHPSLVPKMESSQSLCCVYVKERPGLAVEEGCWAAGSSFVSHRPVMCLWHLLYLMERQKLYKSHCLFYFSQHKSQGTALAQVAIDEKCVCQCPGNSGGETIGPLLAGVF